MRTDINKSKFVEKLINQTNYYRYQPIFTQEVANQWQDWKYIVSTKQSYRLVSYIMRALEQ